MADEVDPPAEWISEKAPDLRPEFVDRLELVDSSNLWHPLAFLAEKWWSMPDEILKLSEVATLLKVAEKTVYTMAQKAEIPAFKVRGQWRFKRQDIDVWIERQKSESADPGGRGEEK